MSINKKIPIRTKIRRVVQQHYEYTLFRAASTALLYNILGVQYLYEIKWEEFKNAEILKYVISNFRQYNI